MLNFNIKIPSYKYEKPIYRSHYFTKEEVINAMTSGKVNCSSSKYYFGAVYNYNREEPNEVVVYSVEKRRGRRKRNKKGKYVKNGEMTHWIGYKTTIPIELLKLTNQKVVQHKHHWTIEKIK